MKHISKVIIFIICSVLGIIIATQARTVNEFEKRKKLEQISYDVLLATLENDKNRNNTLRDYLEELQSENDRYIEEQAIKFEDLDLLNKLKNYKTISGLSDIEGEGIIITLDDALAREYINPQSLIIHDVDIQILLNELKAAGAIGLSVNDERILDISEQICAGPTILINKNRYATPYIIKVRGNKDMLYDAILSSSRYKLMLEDGIRIDIEKKDDILIKGYKGKISSLISGLEVINNEN